MEEYTNTWVDLVNRGGLDQVNDKFILIKAVEMEARTILNQELLINYCGEELKTVLYNTFSKSENIEACWHNITWNTSNLPVKKMTKNAFVKSWIQMKSIKVA